MYYVTLYCQGEFPLVKHYYDHTRAGTVEIHVLSMLGVIGAGLYTCSKLY